MCSEIDHLLTNQPCMSLMIAKTKAPSPSSSGDVQRDVQRDTQSDVKKEVATTTSMAIWSPDKTLTGVVGFLPSSTFRRHPPQAQHLSQFPSYYHCRGSQWGVGRRYDETKTGWPEWWWTSPWSSTADSALWDKERLTSGSPMGDISYRCSEVFFLRDPRAWEEKGGEQAMVPSRARMLMIDVCSWLNTSTS